MFHDEQFSPRYGGGYTLAPLLNDPYVKVCFGTTIPSKLSVRDIIPVTIYCCVELRGAKSD